jgi:LacI family transcriptional regulator
MASPRPGSTATIYSVAALAGVSIATVSRVLQGSANVSDTNRTRVLDAVVELNYVAHGAARSLAVRHQEAHGLVLPELTGPYYANLLLGFESRAAELGQSVLVLLAAGKQDLADAVRHLATRVDGLAMLGSATVPDEVIRSLRGNKPLVVIAGPARPGVEAVGAENYDSAVFLATHLLADHGRRHLLFVGDPQAAPDVSDRYRGFVDAHTARRRKARPPVAVPFREAEGGIVAGRLLAGTLTADAVVCANDELALSLILRLQEGGLRVPQDIAVVGWDDVMTARYIRPALTTVRHPVEELGALAAERLHQRVIGSPAADRAHLLPTEVVLRASCGCVEQPAPRNLRRP